ncbi:MAG: acetyltransferase [Nitrosomonadales bacterium]|nr:acetyltransferase [Nitrosomonadales bacterium]
MRQVDVFNGDADGLCALHQLRLALPAAAELVTGVKRDIKLLDRVNAGAGEQVSVFDISLDSNRGGLMRLLEAGASVEYFDHHHAGEIPQHRNLVAHIDLSAGVCSSMLVDRCLAGQYRPWAIAAAFGDNLAASARAMAAAAGLAGPQTEKLERLGEYLNYNSYGDSLADLHFHPADLYGEIKPYADPFVFIAESEAFPRLAAGFHDDMLQADTLRPLREDACCAAYMLPDAPWARRVSGIFANRLANSSPARAHAVFTLNRYGEYTVSVRAPIANPQGADTLCLMFDTGGGRTAAAGINRLPAGEMDRFLASFKEQFGK